MDQFTPVASTIGGLLIGLSASLMLLLHGRIAGISGILGGLLQPRSGDIAWRILFLGGLVTGGILFAVVSPDVLVDGLQRSTVTTAAAGLLVGIGTQLSHGCTSGHGVCGLSRFSPRSAVAVVVFMTTGAIAAYISQRILGGDL